MPWDEHRFGAEMEENLKQLLDERDIINIVNSIGINADRRNWGVLSQAFAGEVLLDYSSMGSPVEKLKPAEIIIRWKALLPGFKMTQHIITNHRVTITGDEAECFSYVVATHYLPNQLGKLTATLVDGNTELPQMAMEAVKKTI
jgi:SnoaL-like domain